MNPEVVSASQFEAANLANASRLQRLVDSNVMGIVIANNKGAITEANDAFLATVGYTRDDLVNGKIDWRNLTPPEWLPLDERAIEQLANDGICTQYEKEYFRKDGSRVPVSLGGARIAGTQNEQICYIIDLSEKRRAESALLESEARYRMLAEALPQIVILTDDERRPFYANRYFHDFTGVTLAQISDRWRDIIHPDDLADLESARASGGTYELELRIRRDSDKAYRWHFLRSQEISGEGGAARWLATAMDIDDRKRAEESLRFIEKASYRLSESLDLETTLETLLDLVIPAVGDWAAINIREDDGRIKTIAARHIDPQKKHLTDRLRGAYYHKESGSVGTAAVYRSGSPQIIKQLRVEDLPGTVHEPYVRVFEEMGLGSLLALPIMAGDIVIGSFGISSIGERRIYSPADLAPLNELARRAGFAIQNARRFEREHRVADVLQAAALPRALPAVDGFTLDAHYRPGREEASIGGDWFDALVLADGRLVVSIGDVAGSGLDAAVTMSSMRQVMRGVAHVYADPIMMLEAADRVLRSEREDRMVTAFVGVIDPVRKTMLYASAGHLPPLLRTADGQVVELLAPGLPLGYRSLATSGSRTAILPRGSALLLYTDGLVESSHNILAGETRLRKLFADVLDAKAENPARVLADRVLSELGARDDVAVLTVLVDP